MYLFHENFVNHYFSFRLVTPEIYGNNQTSTITSGDLISIVSSNIATLTSDVS